MNELLKEYIAMYGKSNWSLSTYSANVNMIKSYIQPYLGAMKLEDITARVLEKYYQSMLRTQAVPKCTDKKYKKEVSLYQQKPYGVYISFYIAVLSKQSVGI